MKYFFGLVALILFSGIALSQTINVKFKISPSQGSNIQIDNENYDGPQDEYIALGFNARKGITEHTIVISKDGYDSQTFTFNDPKASNQTINVELERKVSKFERISDFAIAFEKIVSGLEYNTQIGADYRWKYDIKEEINLGEKKDLIDASINKSGIGIESMAETKGEDVDDLFETKPKANVPTKKKQADLLLAAKVMDFKLTKTSAEGFFKYSEPSYEARVEINWQLFEKKSKSVVFKKTITNTYSFRSSSSSTTLSEFFNSMVENFNKMLISDSEFKEFVENYNGGSAVYEDEITLDENGEEITTQKIFIPQAPEAQFEEFSDLVKVALKSSVTIIREDKGHGSGVIISPNGYVVTNHHVVDSSKTIDVQFSNGMILPAEIIESSEKHDLALVKVNVAGLTALPVVSSGEQTKVGEEVFVVGSPGDAELSQSVTKGIISGKRNFDGVKAYQTDTKVSPGNSGSPLINMNGEVIGIINMKVIGDGIEGISFAIDAKYIFSVLGIVYE